MSDSKADWRDYSSLVGDEYTLKILADTYLSPKSVHELSIKHDIPIAACYRKVHRLEKLGLLQCVDRKVSLKGKRVKIYQSCVRNITLFFENGHLKVKLDLTTRPEINNSWDILEAKL